MATANYEYQYWTITIAPGSSQELVYGPFDAYSTSAIQVTCCPATTYTDANGRYDVTETLSVSELDVTAVPNWEGDVQLPDSVSIGFSINNRGSYPVDNFGVAISWIGA